MTGKRKPASTPSGIGLIAILVIIQAAIVAFASIEQIALGMTGTVTTADAPTSATLIGIGSMGILMALVLCLLAWRITRADNPARWAVLILSLVRSGIDLATIVAVPASRLTSVVALALSLTTAILLLTPAARRYFETDGGDSNLARP